MGFKHVKVEDNTGMSASTKRHHRKYNHEHNTLVFSQYMYFLFTSSPAALFFSYLLPKSIILHHFIPNHLASSSPLQDEYHWNKNKECSRGSGLYFEGFFTGVPS